LSFDLLPTSYIFSKGRQIRITVTGADFRETDRTPAAPDPELSILDQPDMASFVSLPLVD